MLKVMALIRQCRSFPLKILGVPSHTHIRELNSFSQVERCLSCLYTSSLDHCRAIMSTKHFRALRIFAHDNTGTKSNISLDMICCFYFTGKDNS